MEKYLYLYIEKGAEKAVEVESDCTPNAVMKARENGATRGDKGIAWRCFPVSAGYDQTAVFESMRTFMKYYKRH